MTRTDKKLLIGLLMFGLLILFLSKYLYSLNSAASQAVVKAQGRVILTIDLNDKTEPERYTVEGKIGPAVIEVRDKKVRMSEAACPDQICVKQGWIDAPGQSIICVPNEIVIYIENSSPIDAITR